MEVNLFHVDNHHALRVPAAHFKQSGVFRINRNFSPPVHTQQIVKARDEKQKPNTRRRNNIGEGVQTVISGPIWQEESFRILHFHKARLPTPWGDVWQGTITRSPDTNERRKANKRLTMFLNVVELLIDRFSTRH